MKRCRGFSLLEVLVALAVLTASLGVLLEFFAGSLSASANADQLSRAIVIAQSKLAAAGVDTPLIEGVSQGTTINDYAWRVVTTPAELPRGSGSRSAFQLYSVTAEVKWPAATSEPTVSLQTLKLDPGS